MRRVIGQIFRRAIRAPQFWQVIGGEASDNGHTMRRAIWAM